MSDSNFRPGGSGSGASLPFVSIDVPADLTRAANAGPNAAGSERSVAAGVRAPVAAPVAAPFVSVDIPDVARAAKAGPDAGGSGSDTPLPFVSIDIPADVP
jgi:hypothetical protein